MKSKYLNIPLLLLNVRELMMQHFRPTLNQYQLTEQQWRIIRELYEVNQLEPRELCEKCCISSPSMAGILKRMEEMDLVIKVPSNSDKRRIIVMLTSKTYGIIDSVLKENNATYQQLIKKIGKEEMQDLTKHLLRTIEKLKKED